MNTIADILNASIAAYFLKILLFFILLILFYGLYLKIDMINLHNGLGVYCEVGKHSIPFPMQY